MRGRLRDIARATHRRHLLIWHVEAGSVKLSGRAGVIGMASSPTKPCRRNPSGRTGGFSRSSHKLPHRAREIAGNRPSSGQTPNKNVGKSAIQEKHPRSPKRENTAQSAHPRQTPTRIRDITAHHPMAAQTPTPNRDITAHQPISRQSPETTRDSRRPQTPLHARCLCAPPRHNKKPHTQVGMR